MAFINFKAATGRIFFDAGLTDDGKLIRKSKTYSNVVKDIDADNLYKGLEALARLSELPFIGAEKIETAILHN